MLILKDINLGNYRRMAANGEGRAPATPEDAALIIAMMGGDMEAVKNNAVLYATMTAEFFRHLTDNGVGIIAAVELTKEFLRGQFFLLNPPFHGT